MEKLSQNIKNAVASLNNCIAGRGHSAGGDINSLTNSGVHYGP